MAGLSLTDDTQSSDGHSSTRKPNVRPSTSEQLLGYCSWLSKLSFSNAHGELSVGSWGGFAANVICSLHSTHSSDSWGTPCSQRPSLYSLALSEQMSATREPSGSRKSLQSCARAL